MDWLMGIHRSLVGPQESQPKAEVQPAKPFALLVLLIRSRSYRNGCTGIA